MDREFIIWGENYLGGLQHNPLSVWKLDLGVGARNCGYKISYHPPSAEEEVFGRRFGEVRIFFGKMSSMVGKAGK